MISKELNLKLIELLPEIKELHDEETSWQEDDETGSPSQIKYTWESRDYKYTSR